MSKPAQVGESRTSRVINASREAIYHALTDPDALVAWRVPGDMTATMHHFDLRIGGGYQMSLFYPVTEQDQRGKTSGREDRFTARFAELERPARIVEAITFASDDPGFGGEMSMITTLDDVQGNTLVTMTFENLPPGVRPEDNDAGTRSSLEKLARLVEAP